MSALDAFEEQMNDAYHLVNLVDAFTNQRQRRMRVELRQKIGEALKIPDREHDQLDCLESDDVFLVFLPGTELTRDDFADARPLLRQALVAACAATETYLGDKVMEKVGPLLRSPDHLTKRLGDLSLTVETWMVVDSYQRKRRGLREHVVGPAVREHASTASSKVGELLSLAGVRDWAKKVDRERGAQSGDTVRNLDRITSRRNRIAHQGDRKGRGRASLDVEEVVEDLDFLESFVDAVEVVCG